LIKKKSMYDIGTKLERIKENQNFNHFAQKTFIIY
jgi:hypothetical protein